MESSQYDGQYTFINVEYHNSSHYDEYIQFLKEVLY